MSYSNPYQSNPYNQGPANEAGYGYGVSIPPAVLSPVPSAQV
jgi:hypothetical protein